MCFPTSLDYPSQPDRFHQALISPADLQLTCSHFPHESLCQFNIIALWGFVSRLFSACVLPVCSSCLPFGCSACKPFSLKPLNSFYCLICFICILVFPLLPPPQNVTAGCNVEVEAFPRALLCPFTYLLCAVVVLLHNWCQDYIQKTGFLLTQSDLRQHIHSVFLVLSNE